MAPQWTLKTTPRRARKDVVTQPADEDDDRQLVARAGRGDEAAFRTLVERYTPRIYTLVSGMLANPSDVEDVVQEVFFKVHRKMDGFAWKSAFFTWLYRIALNTATDHLKKRKHRRTTSLDELTGFDAPDEQCPTPTAELDHQDLRRILAGAIAELPRKYRDILVLREYEQLSYDDIAGVLGCSKGTVESRLFRARARLKDKIGSLLR